jgi:hypothetical protein
MIKHNIYIGSGQSQNRTCAGKEGTKAEFCRRDDLRRTIHVQLERRALEIAGTIFLGTHKIRANVLT